MYPRHRLLVIGPSIEFCHRYLYGADHAVGNPYPLETSVFFQLYHPVARLDLRRLETPDTVERIGLNLSDPIWQVMGAQAVASFLTWLVPWEVVNRIDWAREGLALQTAPYDKPDDWAAAVLRGARGRIDQGVLSSAKISELNRDSPLATLRGHVYTRLPRFGPDDTLEIEFDILALTDIDFEEIEEIQKAGLRKPRSDVPFRRRSRGPRFGDALDWLGLRQKTATSPVLGPTRSLVDAVRACDSILCYVDPASKIDFLENLVDTIAEIARLDGTDTGRSRRTFTFAATDATTYLTFDPLAADESDSATIRRHDWEDSRLLRAVQRHTPHLAQMWDPMTYLWLWDELRHTWAASVPKLAAHARSGGFEPCAVLCSLEGFDALTMTSAAIRPKAPGLPTTSAIWGGGNELFWLSDPVLEEFPVRLRAESDPTLQWLQVAVKEITGKLLDRIQERWVPYNLGTTVVSALALPGSRTYREDRLRTLPLTPADAQAYPGIRREARWA